MYLLLLSVFCCYKTCIHLYSVITKSFDITRMYFTSNNTFILLSYSNVCIFLCGFLADKIWRRIRLADFFSADFQRSKIRRRIRLSAAAWGLGSLKLIGIIAQFDRSHVTSSSSIVTRPMAVSCTVFKLKRDIGRKRYLFIPSGI